MLLFVIMSCSIEGAIKGVNLSMKQSTEDASRPYGTDKVPHLDDSAGDLCDWVDAARITIMRAARYARVPISHFFQRYGRQFQM